MKYEYSVEIVWSKEDGAYLAVIQELQGCMADGRTREEALANVIEIATEWTEVAKEKGRTIPMAQTVEDRIERKRQFDDSVNAQIRQTIAKAVSEIVPRAVQEILDQLNQEQAGALHFRGVHLGHDRQVDVVKRNPRARANLKPA